MTGGEYSINCNVVRPAVIPRVARLKDGVFYIELALNPYVQFLFSGAYV